MARRWFRTELERASDRISAQAAELGWTVAADDAWSAVYGGIDRRGQEFAVLAIYGETSDVLEWRGGTPRLDGLAVAIANVTGADRSWVRSVQIPGGLAGRQLDPEDLRAALNAKAAEGLSPAELNDYALELGGGSVDGLIARFERSAVEVEPGMSGLTVLAAEPGAAAGVLTDDVRARIEALVPSAAWPGDAPTLMVFAGNPFSKVRVEVRGTTVDLLRAIGDLGSELRARIERSMLYSGSREPE